jgi:hypothetical protein
VRTVAQGDFKGIREIEEGSAPVEGRIRRPGAGRKPITVSDPRLVDSLEVAEPRRGSSKEGTNDWQMRSCE